MDAGSGARQQHAREAFSAVVGERDEADDRVVEPQLVAAIGARRCGSAQQACPALGRGGGVVALHDGARDHHVAPRLRLPVRPRPAVAPHHVRPAGVAVDGEQAAPGVPGVKVDRLGPQHRVAGADVLHDANPQRAELGAARVEVVAIDDAHVAAVAAAAIEVPACCGVVPDRRDDLQEGTAQRPERVVQAILAHAGIAEADLGREHGRQLPLDGLERAGDERDLAQAEIRWCHRFAGEHAAGAQSRQARSGRTQLAEIRAAGPGPRFPAREAHPLRTARSAR